MSARRFFVLGKKGETCASCSVVSQRFNVKGGFAVQLWVHPSALRSTHGAHWSKNFHLFLQSQKLWKEWKMDLGHHKGCIERMGRKSNYITKFQPRASKPWNFFSFMKETPIRSSPPHRPLYHIIHCCCASSHPAYGLYTALQFHASFSKEMSIIGLAVCFCQLVKPSFDLTSPIEE